MRQVNKKLVSLNLSWNGVDNRACGKLSFALTQNNCLKSFDLSRTEIDSVSVERLVKALRRNTSLTSLNVSAVLVTGIKTGAITVCSRFKEAYETSDVFKK